MDYKIIKKIKLRNIGDAVRSKYNEKTKYSIDDLFFKLSNIPQKVHTNKTLFDNYNTLLDISYLEGNEQYTVLGVLHNPIIMEKYNVRFQALKGATIKLHLKNKKIETTTDKYGVALFNINKNDVKPYDIDKAYCTYDGIENKHNNSISEQILPVLRLDFKGDKLSYAKRYAQEIKKGITYYDYHQIYVDWYSPDDGFSFWVDGEEIKPLWQNPPSDSSQAQTESTRFDHVVLNLNKGLHSFYIFNKNQLIRHLPERSFAGWEQINHAFIPASVETIGDGCFADSSIEKVTMCDSILSLGSGCFMNCLNLTEIKLPSKLIQIPSNCFRGCESLTSIEIPENVKTIGVACFENCKNLNTVIMRPMTPPQSFGSFTGMNTKEKASLVVPDNSFPYYKTEYGNIFNIVKESEYRSDK